MFEIFKYLQNILFTRNTPTPITILAFIIINISNIQRLFKKNWNFFVFLSYRESDLAIFFQGHCAISIKHTCKPTIFIIQCVRFLKIQTQNIEHFLKLSQTNRMSKKTIYIIAKIDHSSFIMLAITKCFSPCASFDTSPILLLDFLKHFFIFSTCCNFKRSIASFRNKKTPITINKSSLPLRKTHFFLFLIQFLIPKMKYISLLKICKQAYGLWGSYSCIWNCIQKIPYHIGYLLIPVTQNFCYRSGIIQITYAFSKCYGLNSHSIPKRKEEKILERFQLTAYYKTNFHKLIGPHLTKKPKIKLSFTFVKGECVKEKNTLCFKKRLSIKLFTKLSPPVLFPLVGKVL